MIWRMLLDVIFPKYCLNCGKEGQYICKDCELFMNEVNNAGNLTTFWEYNGIVEEAIKQIKYRGVYDIVKELVDKGLSQERPDLLKARMQLGEVGSLASLIITFVPMHLKKERKRGFNQAEIIAKELGKKVGLPVIKLLEKIKETPEQAKLDKKHRLENLKDSFKVCDRPGLSQNVLLVDDVYTTGSTMSECAKVLRQAGYKDISYFAIARTV